MRLTRPTSHRLLCAIARAVFAPTIDDFEWSERIKRRLVAQQFVYPRPHEITAALRAVERALMKGGTVRPCEPPRQLLSPRAVALVRASWMEAQR